MSDPRIVPAAEAKRLREAATPGPWFVADLEEGWYLLLGSNPDRPFTFPHLAKMEEAGDADLARLAPDLAHTVVEQAAQIEQLDTALGAVSPQSLAQGRKLRRQAAQIERVREALHRIEQADERAQHDWDTNYNPDSQNEAMAYSLAAQWLEEALGDTDD